MKWQRFNCGMDLEYAQDIKCIYQERFFQSVLPNVRTFVILHIPLSKAGRINRCIAVIGTCNGIESIY